MTSSENMEISDMIERAFETFGGRATKAEMLLGLLGQIPPHLGEYLVAQGLNVKIGAFFRQKSVEGLPVAPAVDDIGTHVQLELLTVAEYEYAISRQQSNSAAALATARRLADKCFATHGVRIAVERQAGAA